LIVQKSLVPLIAAVDGKKKNLDQGENNFAGDGRSRQRTQPLADIASQDPPSREEFECHLTGPTEIRHRRRSTSRTFASCMGPRLSSRRSATTSFKILDPANRAGPSVHMPESTGPRRMDITYKPAPGSLPRASFRRQRSGDGLKRGKRGSRARAENTILSHLAPAFPCSRVVAPALPIT